MAESKNLYELTSKLEQVGYDYEYTDDTIVTLSPSNDHCVNLIIDVVDLKDSVSFRIDLIWDDVTIKSKKYKKISVSNAILILTNILENIKEIDTKAHHCLDSFDTIMYPVGVGVENAVKSIKETLRDCGGKFVGGHLFRIERVGVVEATYGYPSNSQFLVEIDVPSKNVVGATTHVFIGSDFSYSTENEFYSLDELKEYLEVLDKLNDEDFLNAREEMDVALSSYFKELFQCEV